MSPFTLSKSPEIWWYRWFLASGLGWLFGNWIANLGVVSLIRIIERITVTHTINGIWISFISSLLRGAFIGIVIGLLQWVSLKKYINHAMLWIISTIFCWSLAHIIGAWVTEIISILNNGRIPNLILFTSIGISAGLSLGIFQWKFAKDAFGKQVIWALTSIISWSLPFMLYATLFNKLSSMRPNITIDMINQISFFVFDIIGFVAALITILLLRMSRQGQFVVYANQSA